MKAKNIIDNAAYLLNEDFSEPQIWRRSELLNYISAGQIELIRRAMLLEEFTIERAFNGKSIYVLPQNSIIPTYVAYDNQELERTRIKELDMIDTDWLNTSGTPKGFYQESVGLKQIGIYPSPNKDGTEVRLTDDYGIVTYVEITPEGGTATLQTLEDGDDYGIMTYMTYNNGEIISTVEPDYGLLDASQWSRDNLTLILKTSAETVDSEDDSLSVNEGLDFVIRDYTVMQAFLREGDGRDLEKAIHFRERFRNLREIVRGYCYGS